MQDIFVVYEVYYENDGDNNYDRMIKQHKSCYTLAWAEFWLERLIEQTGSDEHHIVRELQEEIEP